MANATYLGYRLGKTHRLTAHGRGSYLICFYLIFSNYNWPRAPLLIKANYPFVLESFVNFFNMNLPCRFCAELFSPSLPQGFCLKSWNLKTALILRWLYLEPTLPVELYPFNISKSRIVQNISKKNHTFSKSFIWNIPWQFHIEVFYISSFSAKPIQWAVNSL